MAHLEPYEANAMEESLRPLIAGIEKAISGYQTLPAEPDECLALKSLLSFSVYTKYTDKIMKNNYVDILDVIRMMGESCRQITDDLSPNNGDQGKIEELAAPLNELAENCEHVNRMAGQLTRNLRSKIGKLLDRSLSAPVVVGYIATLAKMVMDGTLSSPSNPEAQPSAP